MKNEINIGIVGAQFMGRAHSNAWSDVKRFYNLPVTPVLKTGCCISLKRTINLKNMESWLQSGIPITFEEKSL